jgi:hypothetical protein
VVVAAAGTVVATAEAVTAEAIVVATTAVIIPAFRTAEVRATFIPIPSRHPAALGRRRTPQSPSHESKPKTETKPKSQVTSAKPPATKCGSCSRDAHGKIQRSEVAKRDFVKQSGFPHDRPGYVVDHITPLAKGGKDVPSNMQWQTIAEARSKDKVERR